ncbi:AraC family transcriptional regulator [Bradyrhizobium prioriisuperbiae]|uniref:AraC family transcriptional regulator n=1 Tax=Bradyrhizobium prioriisuperbiae TaxID=2854389 RepID=UPI0028EE70C7|nr:AraC family transcriptional regulator [Bradyrhizobium prioritasuperba]
MDKQAFQPEETHQLLGKLGAEIEASSEGFGWTNTFASLQREPAFDNEFHAVPACLMVMPRFGPSDMTYRLNSRIVSRHVRPDGVFFLPAQHACDVMLHAVLDTVHVYLRADLFQDPDNESRSLLSGIAPMLGESDVVIGHLMTAMADAVQQDISSSSLLADSVALALAKRLIAMNYHGERRPRARPANQLAHRKIQRVREFVEANLATDIKLGDIAGLCGLSDEYFLRQFKTSIGASPYQFVLSLRIGRAKTLLYKSDAGLSDIALQCGFAHQQHLVSTFRRFTGITPGEYRRRR